MRPPSTAREKAVVDGAGLAVGSVVGRMAYSVQLVARLTVAAGCLFWILAEWNWNQWWCMPPALVLALVIPWPKRLPAQAQPVEHPARLVGEALLVGLLRTLSNPRPVLLGVGLQFVALAIAARTGEWSFETLATLVFCSHIVHFILNARQVEIRLALTAGCTARVGGSLGFPAKFVSYVVAWTAIAAALLMPYGLMLGPFWLPRALYQAMATDVPGLFLVFLGLGVVLTPIATWLALRLLFAPLLTLDRGMTAWTALSESFRRSKGHFSTVSFLLVAQAMLVALGAFSHGLALPITMPICSWAGILLYRRVATPQRGGPGQRRRLQSQPAGPAIAAESSRLTPFDVVDRLADGFEV
ncbi:MAG: hypothetical protein JWM80_4831 [Cyanobacteria bacterium RYN_339]|nr:hypothetical protein [Cyanobacteria bacterium RYN_339]